MITSELTSDGLVVKAGEHVLACITPETDMEAMKRFVQLCKDNSRLLEDIAVLYEDAREWNRIAQEEGRAGKNWPIFAKRERLVTKLCREAGIVDT